MADTPVGCYSSKEKAITALHQYIYNLLDEDLWGDFKDCYLSKSDDFFDIGFYIDVLALDQRPLYSTDDLEKVYRKIIVFISDDGFDFKEVDL